MFPEEIPDFPSIIYWSILLLFLGALVAYVVTAIFKPVFKLLEKKDETKRRPWKGWVPPVIFDTVLPVFSVIVGSLAGSRLWPEIGDAGWIIGGAGAVASSIMVSLGFDALGRLIDGAVNRVSMRSRDDE